MASRATAASRVAFEENLPHTKREVVDLKILNHSEYLHLCSGFFWDGGAWHASGCQRERPKTASRVSKLSYPENPPQPPKDTAPDPKDTARRSLLRASGCMSAHLARVQKRSWQRVARFRTFKGVQSIALFECFLTVLQRSFTSHQELKK